MGCGGSKQHVASGNTVSHRRLLRKKSSAANPAVKSTIPADVSNKPAPPPPPAADVKDITVNTDGRSSAAAWEGQVERKLVSRDSPDTYFSSRKDEETVDVVAGGEYFSPRYEPRGEEAGLKAAPALGEAGGTTEGSTAQAGPPKAKDKEKVGALPGQAIGGDIPTEGSAAAEKLNSILSADLKEPILVEETKLEVTIIEKKNVGICEIVSESSTQ